MKIWRHKILLSCQVIFVVITMLVEILTILFGVSFTGWTENEDVVDQHNKSGYFSDIVDFDIPSKYIF